MEKNNKLKRTFEKFEKAFGKYKEIVVSSELSAFLSEELLVEIATKRFEYTFESMWKILKEYFRREGVICSTPMQCFREAFKAGFIDKVNEGLFVDIVENRNKIVHIYDEEEAAKIYKFIKSKVVYNAIESLYKNLHSRF